MESSGERGHSLTRDPKLRRWQLLLRTLVERVTERAFLLITGWRSEEHKTVLREKLG